MKHRYSCGTCRAVFEADVEPERALLGTQCVQCGLYDAAPVRPAWQPPIPLPPPPNPSGAPRLVIKNSTLRGRKGILVRGPNVRTYGENVTIFASEIGIDSDGASTEISDLNIYPREPPPDRPRA